MARTRTGINSAQARLSAIQAELEMLESGAAEIGEDALARSTELTKQALSVAGEVVEDAAIGTLDVAETMVSGAADGVDEARASIRAIPITSILIALGIGVVLGHFTASQQPQHRSFF